MRKEKGFSIVIVLILLIIVFAIAYVIFIKPNYFLINGGTLYLEPVMVQPLDPMKKETIYAHNSAIYLCSRDGLEKKNSAMESVWSKSFYIDQPLLLGSKNYMAVVAINGKTAYLFNEAGFIQQITVEHPIILASLSETGYLALVQENDDAHAIELFDFKGNPVVYRNTRFRQDGYPIGITLSDDSKKMVVSYVYIGDNVLETKISFLDFSENGERYTDRIIGGSIMQETLAPGLYFLNNEAMVVVGDNRIDFFSIKEVPELVKTIVVEDLIQYVAIANEELTVYYQDNLLPTSESKAKQLVTYDKSGHIVFQETFEDGIDNIVEGSNSIYVIDQSVVKHYKGRRLVWQSTLHQEPEAIFELNSELLIGTYRQNFEIYKKKDI